MTTYPLTTWGTVANGKNPRDYLQLTLTTYGKNADGHQQSKIIDDYTAAIKAALPAHWNLTGGWDTITLTYNSDQPMTGKQHTKAIQSLRKIITETDIRYFIEKHTRVV